jgi:hypothetical protein
MIWNPLLNRLAAVLCLGILVCTVHAELPSLPDGECAVRSGLPNFAAKLKAGKNIKIGYLGGSITAQGGWRVLSRKWFQEQYPDAKVSEINAAIGGTGSNLGVFRAKHDVLDAKPDLLFVEFAVNDSKTSAAGIFKSMEGIVRQTWKALPDCDICFIYTITHSDIKKLQAGQLKRSTSTMEKIAEHYGISAIHLGLEVAKLEQQGKLIMKAPRAQMTRVSGDELNQAAKIPTDDQGRIIFSKDGVHPYTDTGHLLYMQAIVRSMAKILPAGQIGAHHLRAPQTADNWEKAQMLSLDQAVRSGPWTALNAKTDSLAKRFSRRVPGLWKAAPGAELRFKFKGSKIGIYDLIGPSCGYVEVSLDGKVRKVRRMDGYCTYYRLATLGVGDKLSDQVHEVVLRVLPEELDKSQVLFERNRKDLVKNPAKYQGTDWYPGALMIIGDLVPATN